MTLKTLTGPSTRDALADARRLFGADIVLLQSSPGGPGVPASVTVAIDDVAPAPTPRAAAAVPDPTHPAGPRAYGYPSTRQGPPPVAAHPSATPVARTWTPPTHAADLPPTPTTPAPDTAQTSSQPVGPTSAPASVTNRPAPPPPTTDEVDDLKKRLASLEAQLAEVRAAAPPPLPTRPPMVFVGHAGSGKTTLALRLTQSPQLVDASAPAVLVVAPADGLFIDPTASFWDAGVPALVVRTADEVTQALRTVADADLVVVDTSALPRDPEGARRAIARLGTVLAPLADVEVTLVVDASRPSTTWSLWSLAATGLTPDALALTRMDEADCAAGAWEAQLGVPIGFTSTGAALGDLTAGIAAQDAPPSPTARPLPRFDVGGLASPPDAPVRDERTRLLPSLESFAPALVPADVPIFS